MHRKQKLPLTMLCAVLLLLLAVFPAAADALPEDAADADAPTVLPCTEVPLYLDEDSIGSGLMVDSVTYVPLLNFLQLMLRQDCEVDWDQDSGTAFLHTEDFSATLTVDCGYMCVNGRYLYFPTGVYNVNGTIIAPIRTLARIFGLTVEWDEDDFAVYLDGTDSALFEPGEEFYDADALYWLSRVIYSEAGNQPLAGMIGVGNVVLNRMNDSSGAFSSTLKGVIFQPGQFDVVPAGTIYRDPSEKAVIAAKLCLEGDNTVGESKWFVNPQIGMTSWFRKHTTYVVSIADHDFYA